MFKKYFIVFSIGMTMSAYAGDLSTPVKITQGMSYEEAREILLNDGWQTTVMNHTANSTPVCFNADWSDSGCNGYYEIADCSGTGMGYCSMFFVNADKQYLRVTTEGGSPPGGLY